MSQAIINSLNNYILQDARVDGKQLPDVITKGLALNESNGTQVLGLAYGGWFEDGWLIDYQREDTITGDTWTGSDTVDSEILDEVIHGSTVRISVNQTINDGSDDIPVDFSYRTTFSLDGDIYVPSEIPTFSKFSIAGIEMDANGEFSITYDNCQSIVNHRFAVSIPNFHANPFPPSLVFTQELYNRIVNRLINDGYISGGSGGGGSDTPMIYWMLFTDSRLSSLQDAQNILNGSTQPNFYWYSGDDLNIELQSGMETASAPYGNALDSNTFTDGNTYYVCIRVSGGASFIFDTTVAYDTTGGDSGTDEMWSFSINNVIASDNLPTGLEFMGACLNMTSGNAEVDFSYNPDSSSSIEASMLVIYKTQPTVSDLENERAGKSDLVFNLGDISITSPGINLTLDTSNYTFDSNTFDDIVSNTAYPALFFRDSDGNRAYVCYNCSPSYVNDGNEYYWALGTMGQEAVSSNSGSVTLASVRLDNAGTSQFEVYI